MDQRKKHLKVNGLIHHLLKNDLRSGKNHVKSFAFGVIVDADREGQSITCTRKAYLTHLFTAGDVIVRYKKFKLDELI
jgi:hypothetical protein